MDNFLYIKTFFSNANERNLSFLTNVYKNKDLLKSSISELIQSNLWSNEIRGKSVLIKPNWVKHPSNSTDDICLITNSDFILTVLEIVAELGPKTITIADAPIQGCAWEKIVTSDYILQLQKICSKYNVPLSIKDFRKVTFDPLRNKKERINGDSLYTVFDLGKDSQLEAISQIDKNPFRVTYYNPDRFKESHFPGTHRYCIANDFLNADLIISLPKIKTHQKTGITCALKNLVGINGDKDYLPHHRIGGTAIGGDCYPGGNYIRLLSEKSRDMANRNIGNMLYKFWSGISYILWNSLHNGKEYSLSAGWYGNDTTWRMVADINKIGIYGTKSGQLSSTPQRVIFSLSDGIIGGQGDGPLNPEPFPFGIVTFTNNSVLNDAVISKLMSFDCAKIPMISNFLHNYDISKQLFQVNNSLTDLDSLNELSFQVLPPPGWEKYLTM